MLLEEVIDHKEEMMETGEQSQEEEDVGELEVFIRQWEKDFVKLNPHPEDNSDFDSDNEVNPLDTITAAGKYVSSQ